jgi:phosphatidylinositol-3-phosphatase
MAQREMIDHIRRARSSTGRRRLVALIAIGTLALALHADVAGGGSRTHIGISASALPCGGAPAPARYAHVIWILFENQGYEQVVGNPALPYTNMLANQCGLATNYFGVGDPSLPNYIAMTSGGTWGVTGDSSAPLDVPSVFAQVRGHGMQWRTYAESMPSNCYADDYPADNPVYTAHHEPALYYAGIRNDCARWDVPLGTTRAGSLAAALAANRLPAFAIIGPNDDGGTTKPGCSRPCGDVDPPLSDTFLRTWMRAILASRAYKAGNTAVFITWDEDASFSNSLCPSLNCDHIATIVVGASVRPGTRSALPFSHYSLLRTTEELLGLNQYLGQAQTAKSMSSAFHLLRKSKSR